MRRIIYSVSLIALLPLKMMAQETTKMSLEDCIEYALKHQAKMKNARLDQKSTTARNREVTGLALPNVKASGGINYAPLVAAFEVPNFIKSGVVGLVNTSALNQQAVDATPNTLPLAFQPKWTTNGQVEASQVLFDPGILVALQARKKLEALAEKNVALTEEQVKVAVYKAYYDILIAEKRKALLDQNVSRIELIQNETRQVYKAGLAEKIDVDRITVTFNNLTTEQGRINQLVDLAYLALKFQIGMPLDESIQLTDSLSENTLNNDLLTHTFNAENRKEYQLLETQHELYKYDLKRYRLGGLPTLALFGNYGYTLYNSAKLFDPVDKWQKSALIGAKLTVPIFDGLQRHNRALQAKYTLQKNENDLEYTKYALELETRSATITFSSNISALENQRKNMLLAEEVYNISKAKYKEGLGSSLEIVNAESDLKEAQTNYFSALYDVITSRINLQKALGEL